MKKILLSALVLISMSSFGSFSNQSSQEKFKALIEHTQKWDIELLKIEVIGNRKLKMEYIDSMNRDECSALIFLVDQNSSGQYIFAKPSRSFCTN
ncbi:hypothetical protein [Halobacteriovorax sp. JY17]|uniref:hypothetical protein n=1 Tax=Halobacteriovorax sp. JY17 TaxID=2014617 RepID=UPI000C514F44|nr:hypothetical protein [Halobacteriovorax sp. JY17]PIK15758.1 MAG: hypothetical protein CES88_03250 [Halobacteriovorax sp. JY17]